MNIEFHKYHGTGNDFILADNRKGELTHLSRSQISGICDRRFGVGGDGFILLNAHSDFDFEMKNYNSDGGECTMCGNGARTLIQFAADLGLKKDKYRFLGSDGPHDARFQSGPHGIGSKGLVIAIKMTDVQEITGTPVGSVLDTGSPHLVVATKDVMTAEIVPEGRKLRTSPMFMPAGVNVNFVESFDHDQIFVRTYERGVEDETLSCGTGVIAAAIVMSQRIGPNRMNVQTRGGSLEVEFNKHSDGRVDNIWLVGPAVKVFTGQLAVN
ncbi:MAG: diaminopimelate epimerase [Bdellovibrionales bacterium]|nr:diaminopimelate epimerase [Bdellovibrionales bacterium]